MDNPFEIEGFASLFLFAISSIILLIFFYQIGRRLFKTSIDPDHRLYTRDHPLTNRFVFAYGLAMMAFTQVMIFLIPLVIWLLIIGGTELINLIFDISMDHVDQFYIGIFEIFSPWYFDFGGYSFGEIIAFLIVGYKIGNYIEEPRKIYFITSYIITILLIPDIITFLLNFVFSDSIESFANISLNITQVSAIIIAKILAIFLSTYYGAQRRDNVEELPYVSVWKQNVYILLIPLNVIWGVSLYLAFGTNLYNSNLFYVGILAYYTSYAYIALYALILVYGMFSMTRGDVYRINLIEDEEEELLN
jgi:hypothetical protein